MTPQGEGPRYRPFALPRPATAATPGTAVIGSRGLNASATIRIFSLGRYLPGPAAMKTRIAPPPRFTSK